jgi:hypothetical protein
VALTLSLQPASFNASISGANSATFPRAGTADPVLAAGDSYWFRCRQRCSSPLTRSSPPCCRCCRSCGLGKSTSIAADTGDASTAALATLAAAACQPWMFCCRVAGVNADGKLGPWSGFNTKALTVSQVTDTLVVTQNRCVSLRAHLFAGCGGPLAGAGSMWHRLNWMHVHQDRARVYLM